MKLLNSGREYRQCVEDVTKRFLTKLYNIEGAVLVM